MSDIFERLKASGLIGEIEAFIDKRKFIAEPGELLILGGHEDYIHVMYYDFMMHYPPFSGRNFHVLIYLSAVLGEYSLRPRSEACDFLYYDGFNNSKYSSSYLVITDRDLMKFNIERVGTASKELLKFFQDQPKIEKLIQIIET